MLQAFPTIIHLPGLQRFPIPKGPLMNREIPIFNTTTGMAVGNCLLENSQSTITTDLQNFPMASLRFILFFVSFFNGRNIFRRRKKRIILERLRIQTSKPPTVAKEF